LPARYGKKKPTKATEKVVHLGQGYPKMVLRISPPELNPGKGPLFRATFFTGGTIAQNLLKK
jgi:hypothetical protein